MKPTRPPIVDPDKLQEEIVAYLDGELPADESREVEQRLATDVQFRDRLRQFERSWGMLDELPRTEVPEKFAASTVEMVAVRAASEAREQQQQWPRQFIRGWLLSASGVLLALLLGFGVVAGTTALLSRTGMMQDADARLVANLPVLLNLDDYQQVDSLVLLQELKKSDLFSATAPIDLEPLEGRPALAPGSAIGRTAPEREAWVRSLAPADKKLLAERLDRFAALPPETQQKMRDFDRELSADPNADALRDVLARYCQWLVTLTPDQRAELRGLNPTERMARITKLRGQDQQKLVRLRAMDDLKAVVEWTQKIAEHNEKQLLAALPPRAVEELRQGSATQRRQRLALLAYQQWQRHGFGHEPEVSEAEFTELKKQLSTSRQDQVARAKGMAAQWDVLTGSLVAEIKPKLSPEKRAQLESGEGSVRQQWPNLIRLLSDNRGGRRSVGNEDELWKFFHEKLTKEERDSFKHLPREEFMQQLRARYLKARKEQRPEGNRPPDGEAGRGPGRPPHGPGPHYRGRIEPPDGPPPGFPPGRPDAERDDREGPPPRPDAGRPGPGPNAPPPPDSPPN